jgi:hypothetical protein
MHQPPPDFDTGTMKEWYDYFRTTKHIPAMPLKYRQAMAEATTADSARRIMTGYVACAVDICSFLRPQFDRQAVAEMRETFDLTADAFLYLDADVIAELSGIKAPLLQGYLQSQGFGLNDKGMIVPAPSVKTARSGPKPG